MESTGLSCAAWNSAGDPVWTRAVVCGADLPAGSAQPNARVAAGGARAAGPAGVRTDLRVGDERPLWRTGLFAKRRDPAGRSGAKRSGVGGCDEAFGGSERARQGSGQGPCRLPAANGGGKARRGGAEGGKVKAQTR